MNSSFRPEASADRALWAGVLSVTRHLVATLREPGGQSWHHALVIATERWGAGAGARLGLAVWDLVQALTGARGGALPDCADPLDPVARAQMTPDETALMAMLRAMSRDATGAARAEVLALSHGRADPAVIRAGLKLVRALPQPAAAPVLVSAHRGLSRLQ